jgi:DNA-binding protein YbaB
MDKGMEKILARAREMQEKQNRRLAETTVESTAAGGKIRGTMNGHRALTAISIDADLVTTETLETVESAVVELVNDLVHQMDEVLENRFGIVDKLPSLSVEHLFGR